MPRPGRRRTGKPTINDVARLAGVSKKTVSRVIVTFLSLAGSTFSSTMKQSSAAPDVADVGEEDRD